MSFKGTGYIFNSSYAIYSLITLLGGAEHCYKQALVLMTRLVNTTSSYGWIHINENVLKRSVTRQLVTDQWTRVVPDNT